MDEKLSQALSRSNFMTTFYNQKQILWQKYQDDLVYYTQGHEINIDATLITFCSTLLQSGRTSVVITDVNNLPFLVSDLQSFLDSILEQYSTVSNDYYAEYQLLKKNRSIEGLVDLWAKGS